ncbi:MAG: ATP-binding protein [Nitrososphaeria archaeon]
MPYCKICGSGTVVVYLPYAKMSLCQNCFLEFYVKRVKKTVEEYKMFREDDVVGVAVSGGKDSSALLHSLRKVFPKLELKALHINLGIPEYSEHCESKVKLLAKSLDTELITYDIRKRLGFTVEDFMETRFRRKICSICGTIKRHIFEEMALEAKVRVLATGHNLDDMVSVMLNTFFNGHWSQLIRIKPILPPLADGMAYKVKPLIRSPEKENLLYCMYSEVTIRSLGCPHSNQTGIRKYMQLLEKLSEEDPGFKYIILNRFLELIPIIENAVPKPTLTQCKVCGFPSTNEICSYCKRTSLVKQKEDNY